MRMRTMRRRARRRVGTDKVYNTGYTLIAAITIIASIILLGMTRRGREEKGHDRAILAGEMPRTPQKRVTGLMPPRG